MKDDPRALVALAGHVLADQAGDDLIYGHVSLRDAGGEGAWMKAAGWGFEEVDDSRVVLVSRSGEIVEGPGPRHIEYPIHLEIMAARPDVEAVVHTHWPAAVAFASLALPLRPMSHDGARFGGDVPRFTRTGDLITDAVLGAALAETLADHDAVLLPHHGLVAVGADLPTAVVTAIALERACSVQLLAAAAGGPRTWSSESETRAKRAIHFAPDQVRRVWDYLVRRTQR